MQREIKFRGKRVDNGEWVYGNLIVNPRDNETYIGTYEPVGSNNKLEWVVHVVIPETVGQYTGLKDKNGKEIYEGDIIQHLHEYSTDEDMYIIEWDDDIESVIGGYAFRGIKGGYIAVCDTASENSGELCIRVIGNLHDNPELLQEVSHE